MRNWKIWQHTGRETKLLFEGAEKIAYKRYDEAKRNSTIVGTIVMEDPDGKIEKQSYGFVDDKIRWGKTPDGEPYSPEIKEVGHPIKDLSGLADLIKQFPETDPDLDEPEPELEPELEPEPELELELELEPEPEPEPEPELPHQPHRAQRMAEAPCGRNGLLTFFIVLNHHMSEYRTKIRQVQGKERKFLFELGVRILSGAPICGSTVKAAFNDSEEHNV